MEYIFTTKSNSKKLLLKLLDINFKEQHWSVDKVCFDVNNLTPSMKHLVWDYWHQKQDSLDWNLHGPMAMDPHCAYSTNNPIFFTLLDSVSKQGKSVLVCQHYSLFLTIFFFFFRFFVFTSCSGLNSGFICLCFIYFLLILVFFSLSCISCISTPCISNCFRLLFVRLANLGSFK